MFSPPLLYFNLRKQWQVLNFLSQFDRQTNLTKFNLINRYLFSLPFQLVIDSNCNSNSNNLKTRLRSTVYLQNLGIQCSADFSGTMARWATEVWWYWRWVCMCVGMKHFILSHQHSSTRHITFFCCSFDIKNENPTNTEFLYKHSCLTIYSYHDIKNYTFYFYLDSWL